MPILGRDRVITKKEVRGILAKSFIVLRRKLVYPFFVEPRDSYSYRDFIAHIGTPPQMDASTEVIDDTDSPPSSDFYQYEQEWTNKLYKLKFWVSRSLFEMDQTGQVFTLLHSAAARLVNWPDKLFFHRLQNATATTYGACYDSMPFFSAGHYLDNVGTTTYSNIVVGSLWSGGTWTASNKDALAQRILNDFITAKAQMMGFKDDRGEPFHQNTLDPENLVILCSPLLEDVMRYAFEAKMIGATSNVMRGSVGAVIASNYLPTTITDAACADWYLAYVGERNRPWIYSRFRQRKDSEIQDTLKLGDLKGVDGFGDTSMEDLRNLSSIMLETNLGRQGSSADTDVMRNERFLISGRWRGEILPGEWRNMILVNNLATT